MTTWRGVIVFIIGVLVISLIGGYVLHLGQPIGGLIFVVSPVLMASLLRLTTKSGWRSAGLRFKLRGNVKFYMIAVGVFPLIVTTVLVCGQIAGTTTLAAGFWPSYLVSIAVMAPTTVLYAACEEFGWRGYLDPQLQELGVGHLQRHLLVGAVWSVWHIPYIIGVGNYTTLSLWAFVPLYFTSMMAMAVWYGEMRYRTGSVWPAVIAHGVANSVIWPLLDTDILQIEMPVIFAVRPDALLMHGLLIAVAVWVWLQGSAKLKASAGSVNKG